MSILSLLLGLFGCGGNKKYTIDDIVLVHTGYYGMESNPVYSFAMRKEEDNWVFSASCRVGSNKDHYTSFSSFPITDEDAQGFLQIIREDGEIERLFKYRNPIRIFHISDAPVRSFGMTFSDGNSIEKKTKPGDRALDYLYALADRHYKSAESVEVTAVSIHRNCMDYSSSCSFCLEKNEGVWLFSFDAEIDRSPKEYDFVHHPDLAQTMAVCCAALGIEARLTGIFGLKYKETDRIVALKEELEALGAKVECTESEIDNELHIFPSELHPENHVIRTYGDHRMALAFSLLGMKYGKVTLEDKEVVNKSFPGFWSVLKRLGAKI